MGAHDQAIAVAQRALGLAMMSGDVALQAGATYHLGYAYYAQGDYRRAIDGFGQAVPFFDGARLDERFWDVSLASVTSRAHLASCHAEVGTFAVGTILGEEGFRIAEAVAHPEGLTWASWGLGLLALRQGDLPKALPRLERALDLCQDADLPLHVPRIAAALGAAYTLSGRVTDAVSLLTPALEQSTTTDAAHYETFCRLSLGAAQLRAGHLAEAQTHAERVLALARQHRERGHQAYALHLLGDIAVRRAPPRARPGRSPLPASSLTRRRARHAPAPGALPWWLRHSLCEDRPP
jgi:tetratricopeptide (TPR) repeat protein